jgi:hypothetical protein
VTRAHARLGWLGPAIALIGVAVAALGAWQMARARPEPGAVIDTIPVDGESAFVVRAEAGGALGDGARNFVELRERDRVVWRALVPRYAGRPGAPGIAWSDAAVSVRVLRGERAELFALARRDASKLGGVRLGPPGRPAAIAARGPVTLTDHVRSYELVSGPGWSELVAVDLASGQVGWRVALGAAPVDAGGLVGPALGPGGPTPAVAVWIRQGALRRELDAATGAAR